jgi:hypothetical protein
VACGRGLIGVQGFAVSVVQRDRTERLARVARDGVGGAGVGERGGVLGGDLENVRVCWFGDGCV